MPTNIKPEDVVVEATSIETTIEDHKIKGTEGTKVQLIDPKGNCSTGDAESDTHASKSGDDTSGTPDDESVSSVNTADIMVGVDELSSNKPVSDGSNVGTDASEHSANVTNSRTAEGTSEAKDTHTPDVNNTESNSDEGGYVLAKYSISDKNLPDVEGSASSGSEKREGLCDAPEDQLETVNDITANSDMAGISGTEQPEKTILPSDKDLEEFVSHSNTNTIEHTDDNEGGNANAPIANMPTAEDTDEGVSSAATSSSTAKVVSSGADSNSTTTDAYSAKSGTTTTSGQGDISATPARTMIIRPIVKATVILGIRVGR
ncbi:hypothetical protein SARC_03028 [Sphaeroforma arctica JP610]|uniref:Uncharacterized protein n=1 Tax=Sphaeroforma arctica JP610 TaxID=667725 RepID=A0A0L0G6V2_9EUKA|nr:hypothetical protein SARC_03028 [Sphaeroforma arctica JP610]KNC84757.1 hypothetical protein SARC_03028 [Sphaeroforma arctica JP610]|eukprot:XP_014158659.1 hypothetical protein SARC_03028 [Sphaeroforma arctica JP610]